MSNFSGKTLMITGGTGSFGNAVLNRFLQTDIAEIRIFSRDEKKQDDMRHEFQAKLPEAAAKIKFFIGDVRDLASVKNAMHGVDYIFHAAALKQVPSCEFFPMEAVKTTIEPNRTGTNLNRSNITENRYRKLRISRIVISMVRLKMIRSRLRFPFFAVLPVSDMLPQLSSVLLNIILRPFAGQYLNKL